MIITISTHSASQNFAITKYKRCPSKWNIWASLLSFFVLFCVQLFGRNKNIYVYSLCSKFKLKIKNGFLNRNIFLCWKVTGEKYHAIILSHATAYQRDCGTFCFLFFVCWQNGIYFPLDYRFISLLRGG